VLILEMCHSGLHEALGAAQAEDRLASDAARSHQEPGSSGVGHRREPAGSAKAGIEQSMVQRRFPARVDRATGKWPRSSRLPRSADRGEAAV